MIAAISTNLVIGVLAVGVLVTLVGHLSGIRRIVVIGILILFLGTAGVISGSASVSDSPAGQDSGAGSGGG